MELKKCVSLTIQEFLLPSLRKQIYLIIILLSIFSSCKKEYLNKINDNGSITTEQVISKFHLEESTKINPPKINAIKSQVFARKAASILSINDSDVTQTFPFPTTLYFSDAQEANTFLSFVNGNPENVTEYYSEHPDFYKRQLYDNGIINDTTSSLNLNTKCTACEAKKEVKPMNYQWGQFCEDYEWEFNQVCVGMDYNYYSAPQVTDVATTVSGWMLGFGLVDLGGSGQFISYGTIRFTIQFQIILSLWWNGVGNLYNFNPESHWGYFWPNTNDGLIFQ